MSRKPPAFQCYAANLLSDKNFRKMSLTERGLFFTMYLESWANERLPTNIKELARYLGLDEMQVENNLTKYVCIFFKVENDEFICPELEDYRKSLDERKKKQSDGGKKGAQIKKNKQQNQSTDEGQPLGLPEGSLIQTNTKQNNSKSSLKEELPDDINEWLRDYDYTRTSEDLSYGH